MTRIPIAASAALALLSGCGETADSGETQLLVPDDVSLHWDLRFNGQDDGLGALVPVELMVYETESGEPVGGVVVKVQSEHDGMVIVPLEDVVLVDSGECDDCAFLWDAWRDQYFEYAFVEQAEIPGGSIEVETDENGLVRVYLYVDAFPNSEFANGEFANGEFANGEFASAGDFASVSVLISTGISDETFYLVPQ